MNLASSLGSSGVNNMRALHWLAVDFSHIKGVEIEVQALDAY